MKFRIKFYASIVTSLAIAALTAGCSSIEPETVAVPTETKEFQAASQMDDVVRAEIAAFPETLPEGIEWFDETPSQLKQENTKYEEGVARGVVTFYWLCAWEKTYIDYFNSNDSTGQELSLKMIERFTTTPFYVSSVDDPDKGWNREILDPAKLGDPTGMKQDYINQCESFNLGSLG